MEQVLQASLVLVCTVHGKIFEQVGFVCTPLCLCKEKGARNDDVLTTTRLLSFSCPACSKKILLPSLMLTLASPCVRPFPANELVSRSGLCSVSNFLCDVGC